MQIMTVKEVSELLKVKPKTIYQWAELNQIPSYKFNGCLRFSLPEIEKWMEVCHREPETGYNSIALISSRKGGS